MPTNRKTMPTTFAEMQEWLGTETVRTLCNNTKAERLYNGVISVTLHGHRIAELFPSGNVWVCDAGYVTVTTYDRLKRLLAPLGAMTYRRKGTGYVRLRNGQEFLLSGGIIRLSSDGESAFSA
jgi:hypothetical protein